MAKSQNGETLNPGDDFLKGMMDGSVMKDIVEAHHASRMAFSQRASDRVHRQVEAMLQERSPEMAKESEEMNIKIRSPEIHHHYPPPKTTKTTKPTQSPQKNGLSTLGKAAGIAALTLASGGIGAGLAVSALDFLKGKDQQTVIERETIVRETIETLEILPPVVREP